MNPIKEISHTQTNPSRAERQEKQEKRRRRENSEPDLRVIIFIELNFFSPQADICRISFLRVFTYQYIKKPSQIASKTPARRRH